ncbi:hypothetical protein FOXG_22371 [Fusarium oxysporum f. sp. lycopersici 4287]|uniref:CFEM domain-containing protein n=1 Tax=Fusarium oxysporum f. sp. lycopersici (strain 4287 / CBS 123668 / FGSC 9935 / NRRL 34936) TaxID=426428 RepID=A0A0J9V0I0_FUSO4|nr:hypothetical protein FOXG_19420 [Fusarium oxysporum f. sp. lycopersici 4287]XP_018256779.1 hypothetical protein FOXG_22352 [Fusarium oxysporum f. sp. lycopersici 4287]XP_018256831.1 hypothetical protein FOXG_22371 [Fusarium oxysporum f. sp. lycopersici 4287]KAJ9419127.1 hypothetical protein QL093DRAFT_2638464 [Fusarium oxysporum]KNB04830.1 hypothetical protein FOXG_19420 [Fusarium oxysporum f. sp. lycopersici 4287]KNB18734.1 hypothetical protein FOXG_22352 [Fusarium oxysporum f. sp. lycoper
MKSFFLLVTALLSSSVLAQTTTQSGVESGGQGGSVLPQCAQPCALKAIQDSKCGSEDPGCVCKAQRFAQSFVGCVDTSCSASDAAAAISAGLRPCEAAGVSTESASGLPSATTVESGAVASATAPIVPPPVVPTQPPVATPTAPAPVSPTPVPTAGANSISAGLASIGLTWGWMLFLFFLM